MMRFTYGRDPDGTPNGTAALRIDFPPQEPVTVTLADDASAYVVGGLTVDDVTRIHAETGSALERIKEAAAGDG